MGKRTRNNILAIAGVISSVIGVTLSIPFFLSEKYIPGIFAVLLLIAGLILLAIGFGD